MIIIIHENERVLKVEQRDNDALHTLRQYAQSKMCDAFFDIASLYPDEKLIWCHESIHESVDFLLIDSLVSSKMEMLSYHPSDLSQFHNVLHYANMTSVLVDNIPRDVRYQTWLMSESIGIVHAELVNKFVLLRGKFSFQLTLNIMSRKGSAKGVLHFSEPRLCSKKSISVKQENFSETLKYIATVQKKRWLLYIALLYLFINPLKIFSILASVVTTKKIDININLEDLYADVEPILLDENDTIDVLIPTLGRKKFLKDVLDDLCEQTHLPTSVIIIEQHPDENVESELDYIHSQEWPFEIKHRFIHQLGACNARNIGLDLIESKWTFLADDDIRLNKNVIEDTIVLSKSLKISSVTIATYLPHQKEVESEKTPFLWDAFSTCTTVLESQYAKKVKFDMAYEFGYGEDTAYGIELRKLGCSTLYTPYNALLHLKAPIGGFRFEFPHPWLKDNIQPKPSPTMMYLFESYMSEEQFFAYKTSLLLQQLKQKKSLNLFKFVKDFKAQWERSKHWSNEYRKGVK